MASSYYKMRVRFETSLARPDDYIPLRKTEYSHLIQEDDDWLERNLASRHESVRSFPSRYSRPSSHVSIPSRPASFAGARLSLLSRPSSVIRLDLERAGGEGKGGETLTMHFPPSSVNANIEVCNRVDSDLWSDTHLGISDLKCCMIDCFSLFKDPKAPQNLYAK